MVSKKRPDSIVYPAGYREFLDEIKTRIRRAQVKAVLSVNRELINLYWHIGKSIVEQQQKHGWGKAIVERISTDLSSGFPGIGGFSPSNIWRMRAFYLAWKPEFPARPARDLSRIYLAQPERDLDVSNLPQPVAEIPWGHNIILLEKLSHAEERLWYARQTIEYGWSRNVLVHQIELDLHKRQGKAPTNFKKTLPSPQSELAQETLNRVLKKCFSPCLTATGLERIALNPLFSKG